MNLEKTLNLLILFVSVAGFTSLALTGTVDLIFSVIFFISIVCGFIKINNTDFFSLKGKLPKVVIYCLVVFLAADFALTDTELITTLINLLVVLHSFKLITDKKIRDYQQILLLSFFQVVASCVLTTSISFGIILVVYLFLSLLALILLNIKKERDQVSSDRQLKIDLYSLFRFEILIIVFVLTLTSIFFLIMPRFNNEFLSGVFSKPKSIKSGFSDEVTLGEIGEIKADNTPVMRVQIMDFKPDDIDGPIYWRGLALDEFNGKSWKAGKDSEKFFYRQNEYGQIVVRENLKKSRVFEQEIVTEPIDTKVLFSADSPVSFSKIPNGKIISYNNSYSLFDYQKSRLKYIAHSVINKPGAKELKEDTGDIPENILFQFAKKPPSSQKFTELAESLYDGNKSYYDNIINVRNYILSNYKYTRVLKKGTSPYPLDDFLFKLKEGHCEYFASAMVLILREMGIPARIVTGFLGGEFNNLGNFYLVRESNAHAWTEVYFPNHGWVLFDSTPEASDPSHSEAGSFIGSYIDFLKFRWSRYVVDFTRRDQLNLFENVNKKVSKANFNLKRGSILKVNINRDIALIFCLFIFSFIFFRNKGISSGIFKRDSDKIVKIYKKTLKSLNKKGYKKSDYLTPDEFLQSLKSNNYQIYKIFERITFLYQEARFGDN
ncbi:MAG: transglutaminaseTgpA domain-containing protein, partial [Thermodesulfobacteriota bacterium]